MRSAFAVSQLSSSALRALNYSPGVEAFREKAKSKRSERLGDLVSSMGPGYGSVFYRFDCDAGYGVELLSQADMFAAEPSGRMIRLDSIPAPTDHLIHRWDVLVAGAGTLGETELYGRSIIADARLEGKYVGPHAMVLRFLEPASAVSLYTYAFLCTKPGIRCIRSTSYGTKVLSLRRDLLSDLPIPFGENAIVKRVAELIHTAVLGRERYAVAIRAAKSTIEDLADYKRAQTMYAGRLARCLSWSGDLNTLSAWNYASTGGALNYLQGRWSGRLHDVVEPGGTFNGPRFARISCQPPYGVDFWSQRDVFLIRPIPRRILHPGFRDRLLFVPDSALLLGSLGQLEEGNLFGRSELAAFGASRGAITQHIMRVFPNPDQSEILYAFLSTALGLLLVRNAAVGTSIPTMHIGLLNKVPIPDLDASVSKSIRENIAIAVRARADAHEAESEAVRIIEEEVLPEWLD